MSGYNIKELVQEAQFRWLRPAEVLFILQNYEETQLNHEPPQKPPSGSLFLFNKRVLRSFRKDGHNWKRRKDGKNVAETHGPLRADEALTFYYARSEDNPHFWRRSYWMLNPAMKHIVLVHYRDITIGKHGSGPISALTLGSSNLIQSCNKYTTQPAANEFDEAYNSTPGPSFLDGSPGVLTNSNGASRSSLTERIDEIDSSPELQIVVALKRIQKQLSLEHVKDNRTFYNQNEYLDDFGFTYNQQNYSAFEEFQYGSDNSVSLQYPDIAQDQLNTLQNGATDFERLHQYQQTLKDYSTVSSQQNLIWKDVVSYDGVAAYDGSLENYMYSSDTNEVLLSQQQSDPVEELRKHHSGDTGTSYDSMNSSHEVGGMVIGQPPSLSDMARGNMSSGAMNSSHEVGGMVIGQPPSLSDMARGNMSSGAINSSHEVGGMVIGQPPSLSDMARGNMSSGAMNSSHEVGGMVIGQPPSLSDMTRGNMSSGAMNSSHEVGGMVIGQPPSLSDMARGNMSSGAMNSSHEVGGMVIGQPPSLSDMTRGNMSSGGTHSYSGDHSAPSWNALCKRDSSPMMTDGDSVQQFVGSEFGCWNDFSEVSSTSLLQGKGW